MRPRIDLDQVRTGFSGKNGLWRSGAVGVHILGWVGYRSLQVIGVTHASEGRSEMTYGTTDVEIELRPTAAPLAADERARRIADPGFGRYFTDHMVTARWTADRGWHDAQLRPYGSFELDPATMALHYGQLI